MVGRRWRQGLVVVITGVWVIQFIAMLGFDFQPDSTVNAAFLLVAGAVFGVEAIRSGRGGGDSNGGSGQ